MALLTGPACRRGFAPPVGQLLSPEKGAAFASLLLLGLICLTFKPGQAAPDEAPAGTVLVFKHESFGRHADGVPPNDCNHADAELVGAGIVVSGEGHVLTALDVVTDSGPAHLDDSHWAVSSTADNITLCAVVSDPMNWDLYDRGLVLLKVVRAEPGIEEVNGNGKASQPEGSLRPGTFPWSGHDTVPAYGDVDTRTINVLVKPPPGSDLHYDLDSLILMDGYVFGDFKKLVRVAETTQPLLGSPAVVPGEPGIAGIIVRQLYERNTNPIGAEAGSDPYWVGLAMHRVIPFLRVVHLDYTRNEPLTYSRQLKEMRIELAETRRVLEALRSRMDTMSTTLRDQTGLFQWTGRLCRDTRASSQAMEAVYIELLPPQMDEMQGARESLIWHLGVVFNPKRFVDDPIVFHPAGNSFVSETSIATWISAAVADRQEYVDNVFDGREISQAIQLTLTPEDREAKEHAGPIKIPEYAWGEIQQPTLFELLQQVAEPCPTSSVTE